MSRHDAGHIFEVFDDLEKFVIMMRAYVVPPLGIRLEVRKKNFN